MPLAASCLETSTLSFLSERQRMRLGGQTRL